MSFPCRSLLILVLGWTGCASVTGTPCSSRTVETEHRVAGNVVFRTTDGPIDSGAFDGNRTNDERKPHEEAMNFEQTGTMSVGWEYHPIDSSKSLDLMLIRNRSGGPVRRDPTDPLERIDRTMLDIAEVPGVGTFPLEASIYCYCPDDRPYMSRDGCSAVDPGPLWTLSRYSDGIVCEPVAGTLEVRSRDIRCDYVSSILPATCTGDLDLTITIPSHPDRRFSGTLRVVEHSTHEIIYCHGGLGL